MRLDHKVNNILYIESILIARKVNKLEYNKVIRKKQVQLKITSKKRLVDKNELNECLVFNATFSNISAISWRPVLVVEEAGVPGENHRPWASNW
jgi:hypothetical protein